MRRRPALALAVILVPVAIIGVAAGGPLARGGGTEVAPPDLVVLKPAFFLYRASGSDSPERSS
ncbi:MAG TPA: hypothetical protein VLX85_08155 [Stellaceae bacterium]|nr:hypothetical protein [Stellaceae bacterium]